MRLVKVGESVYLVRGNRKYNYYKVNPINSRWLRVYFSDSTIVEKLKDHGILVSNLYEGCYFLEDFGIIDYLKVEVDIEMAYSERLKEFVRMLGKGWRTSRQVDQNHYVVG